MTRLYTLQHEFIHLIPDALDDGVLYVSIPYATVIHKCCCGCGNEVATPLDPSDWEMVFDGKSISLSPSIGNWSLPCQSHYWIDRNHVRWIRRHVGFEARANETLNCFGKVRRLSHSLVTLLLLLTRPFRRKDSSKAAWCSGLQESTRRERKRD